MMYNLDRQVRVCWRKKIILELANLGSEKPISLTSFVRTYVRIRTYVVLAPLLSRYIRNTYVYIRTMNVRMKYVYEGEPKSFVFIELKF